ncbi:MAG TPA: carboxypeptidase-like regulatory domain-containing protein, partial [Myxococcota bacterium]|nr:carboxypeptidase-like regulatory domain-containing protein [Myxococcota bacterium]
AASGCGKRAFDEMVTIVPAAVHGSVGGQVVDFYAGAGVGDLAVTVVTGEGVLSATTAADGAFAVAGVPAGAPVLVRVDGGTGYTSAQLTAVLPTAAGQTPLAAPETFVGPIGLLPRDLSLALQVVRDDGTPLETTVYATTSVGWFDLAAGAPAPRGYDARAATSDFTGLVTIGGLADVASLPAGVGSDSIAFRIPPVDADADGAYEFEGVTFLRSARDLAAGLEVVNVDSEATTLLVVSTNVQGLLGIGADGVPSVLALNEPARFVFNQPIDPAALSVRLSDEDGVEITGPAVAMMAEPNNSVVVNPPAAGWPAGAEVNVELHAVSGENSPSRRYDAGAAFFTDDATSAPVSATATRDPANANHMLITFSEPVGLTPGAAWGLGGTDCVVYVMFDLNGDGNINGPNETNGASCDIVLASLEPDPIGLAGLSGYTTRAHWFLPVGIASGFNFELRFSAIGTPANRPTTAGGMLLPDLSLTVF